ncbi:MAG TPA: DUF402 domain-containing protein [Anaerolineales bacterium]|nr:DUF402 domain-containing protein [Anaerolineales bacterium]
MNSIDVVKLNHSGLEVFRYPGWVLSRSADSITLEAFFSWGDTPVDEIILHRGDRFVETYFTDRWYNIFEIFAHDTGALKAYYCNIGYPAQITDGSVSYRDLALDLLILPDGRQVLLDEDEFQQLNLPDQARQQALSGLADLQEEFRRKISASHRG